MALAPDLQAKRFQRPAWSHEPSIWDAWLEQHGGFEPRTAWPAPTYEYFWPYPFPAPEVPGLPSPSAKLGDPEGSARAIEEAVGRGEVVRRSPLALPERAVESVAGGVNPYTELALPGLAGAAAGAGASYGAERLFGGMGGPSPGGGPAPIGPAPDELARRAGQEAGQEAEALYGTVGTPGGDVFTSPGEVGRGIGESFFPLGLSAEELGEATQRAIDITGKLNLEALPVDWGTQLAPISGMSIEDLTRAATEEAGIGGGAGASSTLGPALSTAAIAKGLYDISQGEVGPGMGTAMTGGTALTLPAAGASAGWALPLMLPLQFAPGGIFDTLAKLWRGPTGQREPGPPVPVGGTESLPGLRDIERLMPGAGGTETVGGEPWTWPTIGSFTGGGRLQPTPGTPFAEIAPMLAAPGSIWEPTRGEGEFRPMTYAEKAAQAMAGGGVSPAANPYLQALIDQTEAERRRVDELRFGA